jgi:hypothetical protein
MNTVAKIYIMAVIYTVAMISRTVTSSERIRCRREFAYEFDPGAYRLV